MPYYKLVFFNILLFITFFPEEGLAVSNCRGRFLNPITEINWNMIFPIRIAGVKVDMNNSSTESAKTVNSSLCICPSHLLGVPTPGVLVTFHEPLYVEEIVKTPGCLSSLGGISILSGYDMEQADLKEDENNSSRWQVHWYEYPIFAMLELFQGFSCIKNSGFSLGYITELDPTWQDDAWSAVFAPESLLFANPIAQTACMVDAMAATSLHPLDDMFWCAGSWGPIYPLTGNANTSVDHIQSANLEGAKLIARLARMGMLWNTVGTDAICSSTPMPILVKSEFTIDPVYPQVSNKQGLVIGAATSAWEYDPPQTYPGYENINQVIFQEQQCCLRF